MQLIPTPQILDPHRPLHNDRGDFTTDHRLRAELLEHALQDTCNYAQHLWRDLDALRAYLLDSLPQDPHAPGDHHRASASPTGPDDETGWNNWTRAYAAVTSVLCGPHGDSGYGLSEARREARLRRSPPLTAKPEQSVHTAERTPRAAPAPPTPTAPTPKRPSRAAATAVLAIAAIRGIHQRRHAA